MCIVLFFSIVIGKTVTFLSRKLRLGGGSSFPGRIALRFCPPLIRRLSGRFPAGTVLVTATNGKTTATRMVAAGLRACGLRVVYNVSGANMAGGIATALIEAVSFRGRFAAELGVFEVDEGSFSRVAPQLAPRAVLIGNFFRDQLDRYGEVSILAARIGASIRALPETPFLIINGDDPIVASVAEGYSGVIRTFGLESPESSLQGEQSEADIRNCPLCHAFLEYSNIYLGHLGEYSCPGCGFSRRKLFYSASAIMIFGFEGQCFQFSADRQKHEVRIKMPGRHAVYNTLAALSLLHTLGQNPVLAIQRFADFEPPYGRFERFLINGRQLYLILIKNPAGANVVLRMLGEVGLSGGCLCFLNDLSADGRDISWIYDVHFELLSGLSWAAAGGRRGEDMALRLVYAGIREDSVFLEKEYVSALDAALNKTEEGGVLPVFATYTAMHQFRSALAQRTEVSDFWEE